MPSNPAVTALVAKWRADGYDDNSGYSLGLTDGVHRAATELEAALQQPDAAVCDVAAKSEEPCDPCLMCNEHFGGRFEEHGGRKREDER